MRGLSRVPYPEAYPIAVLGRIGHWEGRIRHACDESAVRGRWEGASAMQPWGPPFLFAVIAAPETDLRTARFP